MEPRPYFSVPKAIENRQLFTYHVMAWSHVTQFDSHDTRRYVCVRPSISLQTPFLTKCGQGTNIKFPTPSAIACYAFFFLEI